MVQSIERILCMSFVAGILVVTPTQCQQPAKSQVTNREPAGLGQPKPVPGRQPANLYPYRSVQQSPAAQYSPLAAQGGYRGQRTTWYEALFHSLNPKDIDWGMTWEQRRNILMENSIGNKYFVYAAALSLLLIYCIVIITWQRWNHAERLKALAQAAADTANYAGYWKQKAAEAIQKHNDHIEKCNRVIEAGESGLPIGDAEANDLRRELDRARTEVLNLTSENKRLRSDLEQKSVMVADLSARVDDATRRIGSSNGPGSGVKPGENATQVAALVDRINRLEAALSAARQENERLKGP